ncbi:MAG: transposase [Alphaproteobacteria bacterium]|nr:transposase [Alphaproteobacteria bacterium]
MLNVERTPLSGLIEADETYIGGSVKGKKGRGVREAKNKTLVGGELEILSYCDKNGKIQTKAGRLRFQILKSASEDEVGNFVRTNIALGSTIKSDGWNEYSSNAQATSISEKFKEALKEPMNWRLKFTMSFQI